MNIQRQTLGKQIAKRDDGLQKVLTHLENNNNLFDYLVPKIMRERYSDEELKNHLLDIYSEPEFAIVDEAGVRWYISNRTKVELKEDYCRDTIINPGEIGGARDFRTNVVPVSFKGRGVMNISRDNLHVNIGGRRAVSYADIESTFKPKLFVPRTVKYVGDGPFRRIDSWVPKGAQGLVEDYNNLSGNYTSGPAVVLEKSINYVNPPERIPWNKLCLVKRNEFDINALLEKYVKSD